MENGTVIKVSPSDSCNETKCEYTDLDQDTMVISMAAENIIGLSGKGECMVEEGKIRRINYLCSCTCMYMYIHVLYIPYIHVFLRV